MSDKRKQGSYIEEFKVSAIQLAVMLWRLEAGCGKIDFKLLPATDLL